MTDGKKTRRNAKAFRVRTPTADDPIGLGWATTDPFAERPVTPIKFRLPSGLLEQVVKLLEENRLLHLAEPALAFVYEMYRRARLKRDKKKYHPFGRRAAKGTNSRWPKVEDFIPRNEVSKLLGDHKQGRPGILSAIVESDKDWQRPGNKLGKDVKCLYFRIAPEWWGRGHTPTTWSIDPERFRAVGANIESVQRQKREQVAADLAELGDGVRHVMESARRLVQVAALPTKYAHDPFLDFHEGLDAGYVKRCKQGRLHYPGNNIPRECRYAFRFDGPDTEPLGVCDVSSAQPMVVAWLAWQVERGVIPADYRRQPYTPHRPPPPGTRDKSGPRDLSPGFHDKTNNGYSSPVNWLAEVAKDCREKLYYRRQIPALERRRASSGVDTLPFTDASVGRVKKLWMGGVFGRLVCNWYTWDTNPLVMALADTYPAMHAVIREMVHQTPHGNLPRLAQWYESYVMVDRVVPRLYREFSYQPFIVIHDAICARQSFLPKVMRVMREEWLAVLGIEPGLDTKLCQPARKKKQKRPSVQVMVVNQGDEHHGCHPAIMHKVHDGSSRSLNVPLASRP